MTGRRVRKTEQLENIKFDFTALICFCASTFLNNLLKKERPIKIAVWSFVWIFTRCYMSYFRGIKSYYTTCYILRRRRKRKGKLLGNVFKSCSKICTNPSIKHTILCLLGHVTWITWPCFLYTTDVPFPVFFYSYLDNARWLKYLKLLIPWFKPVTELHTYIFFFNKITHTHK